MSLGTFSNLHPAKARSYIFFKLKILNIVPEMIQNLLKNSSQHSCSEYYIFFTFKSSVSPPIPQVRLEGELFRCTSLEFLYLLILKPFICCDSCKVSLQGFLLF